QKLREQKSEVEKLQEKFTNEFEVLANKILDNKSEKFTKQNKENIDGILKPLQQKIESFEKKVDESHKESIDRHAMLRQQIIGLKELNEQMSKEAVNLTKALKGDNKTQGNWGELVLERVLEKSGLEKDREYFMQQGHTTNDGKRFLPDVVLHLPDSKKMIIDSKVSLVSYERYVNEEDKELQAKFLKEHISSIKRHIEQLSEKKYQDIYEIESPDFVLLFIPIEPAFAIAINEDNSLYNWAFEKNIVIVTPTTLLATLRTVDSMWNNEKQQQNAIEIATQAGRLYDQFVNLTDDLVKVGNQLNTVKGSYDSTMVKLTGKGNLISRVERLKKLGSKASKQINEKLLKKAEDED
ncbi:MAG: DNA recombination protein RmuC, partial [Ulvibacter sp.]